MIVGWTFDSVVILFANESPGPLHASYGTNPPLPHTTTTHNAFLSRPPSSCEGELGGTNIPTERAEKLGKSLAIDLVPANKSSCCACFVGIS